MKKLHLDAKLSEVAKAIEFVKNVCSSLDCPQGVVNEVLIACEEILVNIVSYAYKPGQTGKMELTACGTHGKSLEICFSDDGVPFDPLAMPDPDTAKPIEEREIGGLGIFLVKNLMDEVSYKREDRRNIVRIVKNF